MNYLLARLKEPSTYAGISTLLLISGLFTQDMVNQMLIVLSAISGGLSIAMKESPTNVGNTDPVNPPI